MNRHPEKWIHHALIGTIWEWMHTNYTDLWIIFILASFFSASPIPGCCLLKCCDIRDVSTPHSTHSLVILFFFFPLKNEKYLCILYLEFFFICIFNVIKTRKKRHGHYAMRLNCITSSSVNWTASNLKTIWAMRK